MSTVVDSSVRSVLGGSLTRCGVGGRLPLGWVEEMVDHGYNKSLGRRARDAEDILISPSISST